MASKKKSQSGKRKSSEVAIQGKNTFSPSSIREFIHEVQAEFKKIVWPSRKVTLGLTGFVTILVIVISLYLGSVDLFLGKLVSLVLK